MMHVCSEAGANIEETKPCVCPPPLVLYITVHSVLFMKLFFVTFYCWKKTTGSVFVLLQAKDCDISPTLKCTLSNCLFWSSVAFQVGYITRINIKHLRHYFSLFVCGWMVWILFFLLAVLRCGVPLQWGESDSWWSQQRLGHHWR